MTKRIFRTVFLVAVSVFLACIILFTSVLYDYFSVILKNQMFGEIDILSQGVEKDGLEYLEALDIKDYRITWIDADGKALYDSVSNANDMENHIERKEVKQALAVGYGESSRYSSTLMQRYVYTAKRLSDGSVIRLSIAEHSIFALTAGMFQPVSAIFAVALLMSFFLASRLSKKIVQPLNEINLDEPLNNEGYDELSPLLRRIDSQQKQIKHQKNELSLKQIEFETVISCMAEGIALLNPNGDIISINLAAAKLFGTDLSAVGKSLLSMNRNAALTQLFNEAKNGERAETVMSAGEGKYQLNASPILSNGETIGAVILLMDITEKDKNEQMRREFTANVSHELKTPLHTISGCAELLANGAVKPEDTESFLRQIYDEAQRMIRLVEDIIKLSLLDEGVRDIKKEQTDLLPLAQSTLKALEAQASKRNIKTELCAQSAVIYGVPRLLGSIIYNLCDNAVKYNREGGSVQVSIKDEEKNAVLTVTDTGIGIPPEHQDRIFERFYRVDKSHSKEIGGTGLGLSIVKHAAKLHGAKIELESKTGEGTKITVIFPKNI